VGEKGKRYSPQFQVVLEVLKGDREAVADIGASFSGAVGFL